MNKRGNFPDVVTFITNFLAIAFIFGVVFLILQNFNTNIQAQPDAVIPSGVKNTTADYTEALPTQFDYLSAFILLGMFTFSIVAARMIKSDPKFMIISILALILLPFAAMVTENIWTEWYNNGQISPAYTDMPIFVYIMNHQVIITLLYSLMVAIALLAKQDTINAGSG
jgi:hypothetical protein